MSSDGFYYLHENGDLIFKPQMVVESDPNYFDSPFVKRVWSLDLTDRKCAWKIVLEALANGANQSRVRELADKWGIIRTDLIELMMREPNPNDELKRGLRILITDVWDLDFDQVMDEIAAMDSK